MTGSLTLLRRLMEMQQFDVLQEACYSLPVILPAEQVLLALARAHLGQPEAARQALMALDPAALEVDVRVDLAAIHLFFGECDAARVLLEATRPEAPDHPLLLARLAACYVEHQRGEEAIPLYERSLRLQPAITVYQQLLRLYLQRADLPQAGETLAAADLFWADEREHWPAQQAALHDQQLRGLRLELWLARDDVARADAWLEERHADLAEEDYCGLLTGYAQRLAERGRHAQAEDALRRGLGHYPEQPNLYQQHAELAELQGRLPQAIALLHRALYLAGQQQKMTLPLRLKLSSVATQGYPALARQMAEQAIEEAGGLTPSPAMDAAQIDQWLAQAQVTLAGVDVQELHYTRAEARYVKVLQAHPQLVLALQGLGHLYMQLGRIDEAVALFEQVLAIDPARGHAALINARRFPQDDETLIRLETLARKPGLSGPVQPGLLLQLAAAWEKRKDYAKAFTLANEANAASRALLSYDPVAHRQDCARIRHAFSRSLFEHRRGIGNDSTLPVFVLGMPRSGTTLVEQILAGHSQIHGAGELGVIPSTIARLERWERHTGSGRHYPDCVDDLSADVVAGITASLLKELRETVPENASEIRHVVDKLPHNFENIGLIKLLFPNARIISVRRDPRDIAISNYFTDYSAKHGGMGFAYDLRWIGEQLADHNLMMHHWNQVFPGDILEVRYEDVVSDPEREARRMLDYVGVQWEPQVLDTTELDRPVKTASVWQVRQPIYQTARERWRRYADFLTPLIVGTNAKILHEPVEMVSLPVPGMQTDGIAHYRQGKLDEAEMLFRRLLHHVPEHATAHFIVGLICVRKGYLADGIAHMEKGHQACPWNGNWRRDLAQAYELAGQADKAQLLRGRHVGTDDRVVSAGDIEQDDASPLGFSVLTSAMASF
ncbi:tetratricopeptide repeat-containing sulfotransferase family protein [Leclercia adecarboxylata]|uniref:tetratricopeptide repeat-containing sulfotransferase family protein n=1 Tax=Leclercia adecarboxylata TaxID=83655 RepID=UPI00068DBC85|nr:tetratricopeptide repeat-containing sulfotransferase family protein [Leclercia adecarboxylata]